MSQGSVTLDVRSLTSALRDFALLLERGQTAFAVANLRGLADRVEEMAQQQADERAEP